MLYLLIFLSALIFTIFFTPYLITYLTRIQIVDVPGDRRIHNSVTPRMGGLIIFAITSSSLFVFSNSIDDLKLLLIGSFIIAGCGVLDDIMGLKYKTKFLLQGAAAFMLVAYILPSFNTLEFFFIEIPQPLSYILLFFFVLGVINSINLLDGLDGLVSGFSLIISIIILMFAMLLQDRLLIIFCTALSGALLGFLKFNSNPARIFLGDTGSLVLGYFLSGITLMAAVHIKPQTLDLTFPMILFAVPVLDTLKVIFVRLFKKSNPFLPDTNHIHHILFGSKIRHKITVFIIGFFTAGYAVIGVYYFLYSKLTAICLFILFSLALVYLQFILVKLRSIDGLKEKVTKLLHLPVYIVTWFRKLFIPVTIVLVALYTLLVFPLNRIVYPELIMFAAASLFLFLIIFFINKKKYKTVNDLYVLVNIIIFIFISHTSNPADDNSLWSTQTIIRLEHGCAGIIALAIMAFIFLKEYVTPNSEGFLTGFDLTVLILIVTFFVVGNIIVFSEYTFWAHNLLIAFIIYLWYKAIIFMNKHYKLNLFYASFALPFLFILFLMLVR